MNAHLPPGCELPADARQRRLWMAVRRALLLLAAAIADEYHLSKTDRG